MKMLLGTGCLTLGILCFIYFIVIIIYAGINTSVSWIWLIGGGMFLAFWKLLCNWASDSASPVRFGVYLFAIIFLAALIDMIWIGSRVVETMKVQADQGLKYVIVLGAQVKNGGPSRSLRFRLDKALDYAANNPETVFILSGGQGSDEVISEAQCMYEYLSMHGLERDRMILENQSTSTRENLIFSAGKIDKKEPVGILSNSFHVYRALKLAKELGYAAPSGIAAWSDPWMLPHNVLREIIALSVEMI